ncbi:MAG: hypothetical protein ACREVL_16485 [Solimonas sp.]
MKPDKKSKAGALKVNVVSMPNSGLTEATNNKWQTEEDMRTLLRAEEVKRDPKRFAAAKKLAAEKLKEMETVAGKAPPKSK